MSITQTAPHSQASLPLEPELVDFVHQSWVFETGADLDPVTGERHPYRTIFAVNPDCLDDQYPLADLSGEEIPNEVGVLMAAAPELLQLSRVLWLAIDEVRSQDARRTRFVNELHNELGSLLRRIRAGGVE